MGSLLNDSKLETLLDRLHARSDTQIDGTTAFASILDTKKLDDDMHRFLADKMIALDRDKAQCRYLPCRSLHATRTDFAP